MVKTTEPETGRPKRSRGAPFTHVPEPDGEPTDEESTIQTRFRSTLARDRTDLAGHRTDLANYRTDLAEDRTEMGMRRTGMAIQRTRMAADRTLMAEIRTALSMIAFGFTLYEAFRRLATAGVLDDGNAPRNFGLVLVLLGITILIGGIWRHVQFALELRAFRKMLIRDGLIHGESRYPVSISLVVAVGLMLAGFFAAGDILSGFGLFG